MSKRTFGDRLFDYAISATGIAFIVAVMSSLARFTVWLWGF